MVLPDLWMHRAGPDRAFGRRDRRRWRAEIALGIGDEFGPAARATEMIAFTAMLGLMRRGRRVDGHAADRVLDAGRRFRGAVAAAATAAMRRTMCLVHRLAPFDA
jgi:hypothetical protein